MIAFIPIKSTSQRIPRKNFQDLGGKPLYQWTLDFALSTDALCKVVVCCDNLEHVRQLGLNDRRLELIGRPEWTLDPKVRNTELIKWWVETYEVCKSDVCLLQPTHPFRIIEDFQAGLETYRQSGHLTMLVQPYDGLLVNGLKSPIRKGYSHVLGDFYFFNPSKINLKENLICQKPSFAEVPFSYMHLNIDTWDDLAFARTLVGRG